MSEGAPLHHQGLRLWLRLTVVQLAAWVIVYAASVTFGRQLLLLDDVIAHGSERAALGLLLAASVSAVLVNAASVFRVRAVFNVGAAEVDRTSHMMRLQQLPFRVGLVHIACAWMLAASTLLQVLRPETNDLFTQISQVVLAWTASAAGELLAYIVIRNVVAQVTEQLPQELVAEASERRVAREAGGSSVRIRLLMAMMVAVGFVATSASLLVVSHVRAEDVKGRERVARDLMALVGTGDDARAARDRAQELGFAITPSDELNTHRTIERTQGGESVLALGSTRVRFDTTATDSSYSAYMGLTLLALITALLAGAWVGGVYGRDLALATREIVLMTTHPEAPRKGRSPRFLAVKELLSAIDTLAQVFERFARVQKRAIGAKESTERMRALFLASMSHDLKSPLNAILGFAEIVKREPLTEPQRESVDIIAQRGTELLELIRTVLDSARMEAGELTLSPRTVPVNELVMNAAKHAIQLTEGMGVGIEALVQEGVPDIFVDGARIEQAVVALLLCAARSTRDGGAITVRAFSPEDGRAVRIDVESPAGRIPRAELESLFVAYRFPEQARKHGSLGLGLSLARSIIEIHGGSLDVESDETGIVFYATLGSQENEASIRLRSIRKLPIHEM